MTTSTKDCTGCGPGYKSPKVAINAPREKILYVACVHTDDNKPDVLATIDVDPESSTYTQIIHKLRMPYVGDELHHSGWNICSSCHDSKRLRDTLVLPGLMSDRVYFIDTKNEKLPFIKKILEPNEMHKYGLSTPHTTHCSPTGEIIISTMGKPNGDALGDFLCIDSESLEVKGSWTKGNEKAKFGYDFWYQPYHDVLISTEWGVPKIFKQGFHIEDPADTNVYGRSLNIYSWKEKKLQQVINLGDEGITPLEIRFLHDPKAAEGFVGCAVSSNVFRFFKESNGQWKAEKVIDVPSKKVDGWLDSNLPGMISDILISLDDKYLYFNNWLHGDVRQYDITNRAKPILVGQIFLGGLILEDSKIHVTKDDELDKSPKATFIKNRRLYGSPQMFQLSLDGRRLYITTSIFKPWDKQFYPDHVLNGSTMVKLDIDIVNGGLTLDKNFLVDFGADKNDILLAHEIRYPGGDCTSDIWLPEDQINNTK